MENKAYEYYREGYNCSACILKAAESYFQMPINKQCFSLCSGINTGMGIGSTCSVLIAAVMVFGLMFDKDTVKRMRIRLFSEFSRNHRDLSCTTLKSERGSSGNCGCIVKEIARFTRIIIEEERGC